MHPNHQAALRYAAAGIKIIPCYYDPNTGKKPPIHHQDHFQRASCDPLILDAWFNTPKGGWQMPGVFVKNEHVLIGLPTGAHSGFDVFDIDVKQDIDGHLTIPGWERVALVIATTPTGGHHLYYRHVPKLRLKNEAGQVIYQNKKVILPGVDVRTTGGYVILPGSPLPDGRAYTWHTGDIVTKEGKRNELLTEPALELICLKTLEGVEDQKQRSRRKQRLETVEGSDHYEQRALTWVGRLAADVAEAAAGTRDETLKDKLFAAGPCVHQGLVTEEDVVAVFWAAVQSCGLDRDGVTHAVLDKKVRDALHASKGRSLPSHLQQRDWLEEMNKQHFFIENDGDKSWVAEWVWDTNKKNRMLSLQRKNDFFDRYANKRVKVGDETVTLGKAWFESPNRRQYHSVFFDPGAPHEQAVDEEGKVTRLNLWRGLALEPREGSWNRLLGHIYRVIARKDPIIFRYAVRWSAWCILNPGKPAGTAVVLRGGQGVGKGLFARALVRVFGPHGMQVTRADDLVGKFNEHLRDCCFLFADEAVSPRDIAAASQLKALITEEELSFRGLFKKAVKGKNVVKVIMASNEAHVTHVEPDDRRNAVFECELKHEEILNGRFKTRGEYFDWLYKQLTDEGYAAMLHDLQHLDLPKDWHPRDEVPETEAREEQKDFTRNAYVDLLEEYLTGKEGLLPLLEVIKLIGIKHDQLSGRHKNWIGQAMRELGWQRKRLRLAEDGEGKGTPSRVYARGTSAKLLTAQDLREEHAARMTVIQAQLEREREAQVNANAVNADRVLGIFDQPEGKEMLQ